MSNNKTLLTMIKNGANIKLLGDSITAGSGSSDDDRSGEALITIGNKEYRKQLGLKCWASLFRNYIEDKFPESKVINYGCSDITSTDTRDNLLKFYNSTDDIIILMIGANDRKQVNGMSLLYNNLIQIVHYFKSEAKTVILMSPNPSTIRNESFTNRLYHMEDVNNVIAQAAEEEEVKFISHYNYIQNYLFFTGKNIEDIMMRDEYKTDGLHPSNEVHDMIFRNLIQNLGLGAKVNGATW